MLSLSLRPGSLQLLSEHLPLRDCPCTRQHSASLYSRGHSTSVWLTSGDWHLRVLRSQENEVATAVQSAWLVPISGPPPMGLGEGS